MGRQGSLQQPGFPPWLQIEPAGPAAYEDAFDDDDVRCSLNQWPQQPTRSSSAISSPNSSRAAPRAASAQKLSSPPFKPGTCSSWGQQQGHMLRHHGAAPCAPASRSGSSARRAQSVPLPEYSAPNSPGAKGPTMPRAMQPGRQALAAPSCVPASQAQQSCTPVRASSFHTQLSLGSSPSSNPSSPNNTNGLRQPLPFPSPSSPFARMSAPQSSAISGFTAAARSAPSARIPGSPPSGPQASSEGALSPTWLQRLRSTHAPVPIHELADALHDAEGDDSLLADLPADVRAELAFRDAEARVARRSSSWSALGSLLTKGARAVVGGSGSRSSRSSNSGNTGLLGTAASSGAAPGVASAASPSGIREIGFGLFDVPARSRSSASSRGGMAPVIHEHEGEEEEEEEGEQAGARGGAGSHQGATTTSSSSSSATTSRTSSTAISAGPSSTAPAFAAAGSRSGWGVPNVLWAGVSGGHHLARTALGAAVIAGAAAHSMLPQGWQAVSGLAQPAAADSASTAPAAASDASQAGKQQAGGTASTGLLSLDEAAGAMAQVMAQPQLMCVCGFL
eukprot:CAMPEP_0202863394 /NCGR_PEP_ID=MMETSP1391-20130828/4042_1 /ASSEMBLY_ACC=CAM_ASM_000867 /TAXON_ID=1034604 /ORGANISM="Chlamydomonas leiostraca, Strain SAG 11-49" /LENGTH=564 /DNA_ID=CAMNT_0049543025 /DNA_START=179 /DNA_END=1873 /DNA_ORIENTATION=+